MWSEVLAAFELSLQAAGRTAGTIRVRRRYVTELARHVPDPRDTTRAVIEQYLARGEWAPATRKSARDSLNVFFDWYVDSGYMTKSPSRSVPPVHVPRRAPRPAPDDIYYLAMNLAEPRERRMLALARHAGLRCVEICAVRGDDLDEENMLRIVGKGGHERFVPVLDDELLAMLRACPGYLFPSQRGEHLTAGHVSVLLSKAMRAGWTAHTLRHAFGTRSYERNPDLLALADVMGHANVNTTRRYVKTTREALHRVVAAAAPPPTRSIEPRAWERAAA